MYNNTFSDVGLWKLKLKTFMIWSFKGHKNRHLG